MSSNVVELRKVAPTPTEKAPEIEFDDEIYPVERYISQDFMELEWRHLWSKIWIVGGRVSDLKEPGDYLTTEIGKESILISRGTDMKIRAFYNICLHRGNRLVPNEIGHADSLICPYHSWVWDANGVLTHVEDEWDFRQGAPCDKLNLNEIPCDTWGGWVWFNLNKEAAPLTDYLGIFPEHFNCYHFEDWALVMDKTVEVECNWKVACDNFNEMYHVRSVHPQLMAFMDDVSAQVDLYPNGHTRLLVPCFRPTPRLGELDEVTELMAAAMQEWDLDPDDFKGRVGDVRVAMQKRRRELGPERGYDFSDMSDAQLTDQYHYFVFPNLTLTTNALTMSFLRPRPHATDKDRCYFDVQSYARLTEGEEPPERPVHSTFQIGEDSCGLVIDQDVAELKNVQMGMYSDGFEGFWMNQQERRIRWFHTSLDDYVYGPKGDDHLP